MKKQSLANLVLAAGLALTPGCVVVKTIATPFAAVRDVVDIPFSSTSTFLCDLGVNAEEDANRSYGSGPDQTPELEKSYTYLGHTQSSGPLFWVASCVFALPDYLLCRVPLKRSPWKDPRYNWGSFFFPNIKYLWGDSKI